MFVCTYARVPFVEVIQDTDKTSVQDQRQWQKGSFQIELGDMATKENLRYFLTNIDFRF